MRADLLLSAFFTALGAFMFFEATLLPKGLFGTLGPGFFPKLVLGVFTVLSSLLTLRLLVRWLRSRGSRTPVGGADGLSWYKRYRYVIISFVLFFLYVQGLKWIGFLPSTLIFMPVLMWLLAPPQRNWGTVRAIVFTTLLLTFVLYGLFTYAFHVILPSGLLFR